MVTRIEHIEPAPKPADRNYPERLEYPGPNGEWTLVFHSPFEWHMGAEGWKASILQGRRDVSRRHKSLLKQAGPRGFRAPADFQPWSCDNRSLALVTWADANPVHVYHVDTGEDVEVQSGTAFACSAQFAYDLDRLLIAFSDCGKLYDHDATLCSVVPWRVPAGEFPSVFWVDGGQFLWIGRESRSSPTVVRVHSGRDGAVIASQSLDPREIAPYDHDAYTQVARTGFTLRLGPGRGAVGDLLDHWGTVRFDHSSKHIMLSVLRPVSLPYRDGHQLICDVEERWITARVVTA